MSILILVGLTPYVVSAIQEEKEYDVIIVGAGISGLAAGKALKENGHDVLILEARDRLVVEFGLSQSRSIILLFS